MFYNHPARVIHWLMMSVLAQTVKRAALNREKARESRKKVEKNWVEFNSDE